MDFVRTLGNRMGWRVQVPDALFDPEYGHYLNDETMQAIRDVESGKHVKRCTSIDDLLAVI